MDYIKICQFKEKLKKELKPQRYDHTMSTVLKAMELCQGTNANRDTVYIAALLHDCAKYRFPDDEQVKKLKDFLFCEAIIHAPLGAIIANEEYGITDKKVLNAIKYHSTGRKNMSLEEMIVCLADAIEDSRNYPNLENINNETKKSIKHGLLCCLQGVKEYETQKGNKIHHLTLEAIDWLKENL